MLSNQSIIEREILGLRGFLLFWYLRGPVWFWQKAQSTLSNFESIFAVRLMIKHLGEPIFQDYTRSGRIIGLLIRLLRIIIGLIFYLFVITIFFFTLLVWLVLPPFALLQLVQSL